MDFVHYQAPTNVGTDQKPFVRRKDGDIAGTCTPQPQVDGKGPTVAISADKPPEPPHSSAEENDEPEVSTRPRLTREQVSLLESQFQAAPKPSTSTKRQLAETTGLSIARVGNWFQNRRAKAKQMKKQEEAELLRTLESAGRDHYGEPSSPEFFFHSNYPLHTLDHQQQWAQLSSIPVDQANGLIAGAYGAPQYESPVEASYQSLSRSIAQAAAAVAQGHFDERAEVKPEALTQNVAPFYPYGGMAATPNNDASYPVSAFSDYGSSRNSSVAWTPACQREDPFEMSSLNMHQLQAQQFNQQQHQQPQQQQQQQPQHPQIPQDIYSNFHGGIETSQFRNPFLIPALPSQVLREKQYGPLDHEAHTDICPENTMPRRNSSSSELAANLSTVDLQSRQRGSMSPPPEGPINIAARRNRPRPANLALRSRSFMGNAPVSPNAKVQFLGPSSPLRRIKSTGNNLNLMRGRVQKGIQYSNQRSPLNYETFLDAGAFRSQSNSVSPTPTSMSVGGSLAPPTPSTPLDFERLQSEGASSSSEAEAPYIFSPEYPGCFVPTTVEMQTNLASPPTTPMDAANYVNLARYQQMHHGDHPSLSPNSAPDEPLLSPEYTTYPSTIHMPQPVYVSPISCGDSEVTHMIQFNDGAHSTNMDIYASSCPTVPEFFYQEPSPHRSSFSIPPQPQPHHQQPQQQQQEDQQQQLQHRPLQKSQSQNPLPKPKNYVFTTNQGPEDFTDSLS